MKQLSVILPIIVVAIVGAVTIYNIVSAQSAVVEAIKIHDEKIAAYFAQYDSHFKNPSALTPEQKLTILSQEFSQEEYYKVENDVKQIDGGITKAVDNFLVALMAVPILAVVAGGSFMASFMYGDRLEKLRIKRSRWLIIIGTRLFPAIGFTRRSGGGRSGSKSRSKSREDWT